MEMARCLLFEKDDPKSFWAEDVLAKFVAYQSFEGKTPFEA